MASPPLEGDSATDAVAGVTGNNTAGGSGVAGSSQAGVGVLGVSQINDGVRGVSQSANGHGVIGANRGAGHGVYGDTHSNFSPGAGVIAGVWGNNSGSGTGVKGTSNGGGTLSWDLAFPTPTQACLLLTIAAVSAFGPEARLQDISKEI
jgi:hypothetical protein